MKKFLALAFAAAVAVPAMADESFGGIGVTIVPAREGVRIVEVIPGAPAAEAGLEAKDRIIAVDGVALSAQDFEGSKNKLRGQANKPVELTVLRGEETLSITLRRSNLHIKDLSKGSLKKWYGEEVAEYSEEEIIVVAKHGASEDQDLVAVLDNGRTIKESSDGEDVSVVFVEKEKVFDKSMKDKKQKKTKLRGTAKLKGINRSSISFSAVAAGNVRIVITDANGQVVENKLVAANAGANTVAWNGESVTSGRYTVSLEQDGTVSTYVARVK